MVLGVLLVGAAAGFWFSEQRNAARYQEIENELAKLQREDDGVALRTYFDQMTQLLLDRNLLVAISSKPPGFRLLAGKLKGN